MHLQAGNAGLEQGGQASSRSPLHSAPAVEYFYQLQVVGVDELVRRVVDTHMRAHLRSEDRTDGIDVDERATGQLYMPSWHMETLLGSLLAALNNGDNENDKVSWTGLNMSEDPAFTLFILNPDRQWGLHLPGVDHERATYGYRCGLSASSMKASRGTSREQQSWGGSTACGDFEGFAC